MQTDCQLMCYTLQIIKIVNTYHCKEIQRIKSKKFLLQIKHAFDKLLFVQLMQEGFAKRYDHHVTNIDIPYKDWDHVIFISF